MSNRIVTELDLTPFLENLSIELAELTDEDVESMVADRFSFLGSEDQETLTKRFIAERDKVE